MTKCRRAWIQSLGNFALEFPFNPGGNKGGFSKLLRHFPMCDAKDFYVPPLRYNTSLFTVYSLCILTLNIKNLKYNFLIQAYFKADCIFHSEVWLWRFLGPFSFSENNIENSNEIDKDTPLISTNLIRHGLALDKVLH